MSKILLLSEDVINKISAGEVVERPKNVIKELVENSIDAKSTKIEIKIKDGGKEYISVFDNGTGIEKDDIKNAFLPHATSKIVTDKDLYEVLSLGFRGEALSSICAVSKVSMTTKTEELETGTKVVVQGANIIEEKEVPFNRGTLIEVSNIFENVPARLKFLKKSTTESATITDFVQKIAICYPSISFKFINNNTTILETSGNGDLKEVLYRIYGREIQSDLIDVDYESDNISIKGLICKGASYRANRNYESFFINNRIVKSDIMRKAVEDCYKGRLPIGKFPIFALSITVSPSEVDINVHPSKEEVRFSDDDMIYDILNKVVYKSLNSVVNIPKATVVHEKKIVNDLVEIIEIDDVIIKELETPKVQIVEPTPIIKEMSFNDSKIEKKKTEVMVDIIKEEVVVPAPKKPSLYEHKFFKNVDIVGQLFDTYWLIEADDTSYIIDQHAAHEKILYEEFMFSYRNHDISTQMLLMPMSLMLSEEESLVLDENIPLFEKFGFEIEQFGKNTYAIRSVPFVFESANSPSFFLDILENIRKLGKSVENLSELYEEKIISMSCKAAVKANDKLSFNDARVIIEKLTKLENPFNCPHGRPTIIEFKKSEIEKMFKRIM